jgi:NAD(P)-dependent dehydrogenase (short-subunit alcohol dehydrogenase family)
MPVAVVTGGGSGIGRLVAVGLAQDGFDVVISGRRAEALAQTAELATGAAGKVVPVVADVGEEAAVDVLFHRVRDDFGRLDLLINNAGTFGATAPVQDYPRDAWDATVRTNLTGAFLCAQRAFALMLEQRPGGGRIINNGSLSAQVPRPHAIAYATTKHALTGLTRALALEGRAHGIACGQVDLGNAATEMTAGRQDTATLQADGTLRAEPVMDARHAAEAIRHLARLPLEVNAAALTLLPTTMPFGGRG